MLDEADKMLSSAGIAEQLAEIRQALPEGGGQASSPSLSSPSPSSSQLQCMLVSATMPASVSRLAAVWLGEVEEEEEEERERGLLLLDSKRPTLFFLLLLLLASRRS